MADVALGTPAAHGQRPSPVTGHPRSAMARLTPRCGAEECLPCPGAVSTVDAGLHPEAGSEPGNENFFFL